MVKVSSSSPALYFFVRLYLYQTSPLIIWWVISGIVFVLVLSKTISLATVLTVSDITISKVAKEWCSFGKAEIAHTIINI